MSNKRPIIGIKITKTGKNVLIGFMLIICIIMVVAVGFLADFLQDHEEPPEGPPLEYSMGYARIYLVDGLSRTFIDSNEIHLIYADNLTAWALDGRTGTTFYSSAGSIFWVNVSGYYPVAKTLYASGGNESSEYRNNTINIFRRANLSDVTVHLVSWQDMSSGEYNYSGTLPQYDGCYRLEIRISITGPSRGISIFGYNQWVPNHTLSTNTFASNSSINFIGLWLGLEGGISDYRLIQPQSINQEVYNINILNCTRVPNAWYDSTYVFEGNFTNLQVIRVYDGLIDNWGNHAGLLTR